MQTAKMTSICSKCGAKYPENGLPYCLKCRVEMSERILASTTMTPTVTTIMTPTKKVGWRRFGIRWWKNWKRKREEAKEIEENLEKIGGIR